MPEPTVPLDLVRMIFGTEPPLFYLEIVIRTAVIYLYALALLRWLGSRTVGQLSTVEFLLVIALGSAVGDAMFYPEVPLAHALLVVTLVVLANKGLDLVMARSQRAERLIDGVPVTAIRDGIVDRKFLAGHAMGRNELFQALRAKGVRQLGEVEFAFFESDGSLSVFKAAPPRPGLAIVPPHDVEDPVVLRAGEPGAEGKLACTQCGTVVSCGPAVPAPECPSCGGARWAAAREPAEHWS